MFTSRTLCISLIVLLLTTSTVVAVVDVSQRIKRIIVLMEENRSYDHMMGWNKLSKNGLRTDMCNYLNASDPKSKKICANGNAPYVNFCDPDHSYPATSYKIFGPEAYEGGGLWNTTNPDMAGFVEFERDVRHHQNPKLQYCGVMDAFTPDRTPVLTTLTEEFTFFDKFFCSVPGPTWPNRLFMLSGTSAGLTETIPWYHGKVGDLFPVKTIFDQVQEKGGEWKYYYDDTPWELFIEKLAHSPENTHDMNQFYQDAATGNLPHFAFINPRAGVNLTEGVGSNDMHPDHDVALGEKLYKDIYEALRASPQWNETLFVLTFDEHGGLFDHMTPPRNVPNPGDGEASYPDKFDFTRGGIRIPTVLASPWLPKGFVVSDPPADQKPQDSSIYELTSIMATTRKLLGFMNGTEPLTKRDGWAATFEHLFSMLDEPRTDCPMKLPEAPKPSAYMLEKEKYHPINGLQTAIMGTHAALAGVEYPQHVTVQGEVGEWMKEHHRIHREKTFAWKRSKAEIVENGGPKNMALHVAVGDNFASTFKWLRNNTNSPKIQTLSAVIGGTMYCWDAGNVKEFATVSISECYPSNDPNKNRDISQHFTLHENDHTIRPSVDDTLCVTTRLTGGSPALTLRRCATAGAAGADVADSVNQRFAYMGDVPKKEGGDVEFDWGDAYYSIMVVANPSNK